MNATCSSRNFTFESGAQMNGRSASIQPVAVPSSTAILGSMREDSRRPTGPSKPRISRVTRANHSAEANVRAQFERGRALVEARRPVEIDLADQPAAEYVCDKVIDAYVRLEEANPGDPGQLSGISIHLIGVATGVILAVYGDAIQCDGTISTGHCFGYVGSTELTALVEADANSPITAIWIPLRELNAPMNHGPLSGCVLELRGGPTAALRVCYGAHILGVLYGNLLTAFLSCLRLRCFQPIQ